MMKTPPLTFEEISKVSKRMESIPLDENSHICDEHLEQIKTMSGWREMETAPKNGTEILGWRKDCGVMLMRWTCPNEFLTEDEMTDLDDDSAEQEDWFFADFIAGGRMEGSAETPTHWMPLPEVPQP